MAKKKKQETPKTEPKKRANKYDEKLKLNGSFDEVMKALVTPNNPTKKKS